MSHLRHVALCVLALAACKPAAPPDDSTAYSGRDESLSLFVAPFVAVTDLQGSVTSVVPPVPGGTDMDAYAKVTVDGPKPGRFGVLPSTGLPFRQGDHVRVEIVCGGPPPYTCGGTVSSEAGGLLLHAPPFSTVEDKGGLPAGWTCARGPRFGGKSPSGELRYDGIVEHLGKHAVIPPDTARELDTPDGRWLVRGAFVELPSGTTPVADWRGQHACSIVRLP